MEIATLIAHSIFGKNCCGCINGKKLGDGSWLFYCNECGDEVSSGGELNPGKVAA